MHWVVVGGAGFVGAAVCRELDAHGHRPHVVDLIAPPQPAGWPWLRTDLLVDPLSLPPGRVVLAHGSSLPRPVRPWTLALHNALATARLVPHLRDRDVVLLSSVEVYGAAEGPLHEDSVPRLPLDLRMLDLWVDRAEEVARTGACSPYRTYELCRELADLDASGRWVYALSKLAQERLIRRHVAPDRLTILRLANVVGRGQFRFVGRLVEAGLNGTTCAVADTVRSFVSVEEVARIVRGVGTAGVFNVSSGTLALTELAQLVSTELGRPVTAHLVPAHAGDSCGAVDASRLTAAVGPLQDVRVGLAQSIRALAEDPAPMFEPALPVVVPPRPERPDLVSHRMAEALWTGRLRGGPWSATLATLLAERLRLGPDQRLELTGSGTAALRLAVTAVAGRPRPGAVALCPAYTFHATAEVLLQLGWTVRLVDIDPRSWCMDPDQLARALGDPAIGVVVVVDALGNPCEYERLRTLCRTAGVPLVADSAPSLGAEFAGAPVGTQAAAHAFSMSFAKSVSAGGSGGAVVLPADADLSMPENWLRSSAMTELAAIAALDNLVTLDEILSRRERVASTYEETVSRLPGFEAQGVRVGDRHAWVHWVTRVPMHVGRDRLVQALAAEGVHTKPYYEALATGPASRGEVLPVARALHEQALALPMSSELSTDDAERVSAALQRALRRMPSGQPPGTFLELPEPATGVSAGRP